MGHPDGDFIVGDRDILLGLPDGGSDTPPHSVPVWISGAQFEVWKLSLQGQKPLQGPLSGVAFERGARPPHTGTHIVAEAPDGCPVR